MSVSSKQVYRHNLNLQSRSTDEGRGWTSESRSLKSRKDTDHTPGARLAWQHPVIARISISLVARRQPPHRVVGAASDFRFIIQLHLIVSACQSHAEQWEVIIIL